MTDQPLWQFRDWRVTQDALVGSIFYIKPQRLLSTTDCRQWASLAEIQLTDYVLYTWPVRIAQRNDDLEAFIPAFNFAISRHHPNLTDRQRQRFLHSIVFARQVRQAHRLRLGVVGDVFNEWGGFDGLGDQFGQEVDRRLAEMRAPDG